MCKVSARKPGAKCVLRKFSVQNVVFSMKSDPTVELNKNMEMDEIGILGMSPDDTESNEPSGVENG